MMTDFEEIDRKSNGCSYFWQGNGEDLGITASYILELSNALKTSALCYDYSGYGLSSGKPSENNCYMDIKAAYNYLISERRVAPTRIVLFGRSLGSGPTVELASQLGSQLGGVVLIAALTSCVRVVFNSMVTTMKFDMFANIDKIERVGVPVFCVHGMDDEVVPFLHGVELSKRAKFPLRPLWIRGAGHNNLESSRFQIDVFRRYAAVLSEFQKWTPPPPPPMRDGSNAGENSSRRRESFGALAKAAGCFGVARLSNGTDDQPSTNNGNLSTRAFRRKGRTHNVATVTGQQQLPVDGLMHLSSHPLSAAQSADLHASRYVPSWSESNGDGDSGVSTTPIRRRSLPNVPGPDEKDIDSPSLSTDGGHQTALALL